MSQVFPASLAVGRISLRRLTFGDAEAICRYRSLPEVARFQGWESFGLRDAERLIMDHSCDREPGVPDTWFQMAIVESATGSLIGDCGLHTLADPRQMEVGITLAPMFQGRGFAAEALGCLLDFAFGSLGAHRVSAVTDAENAPSASLFKRLGFRQEAHRVENLWFKGKWGSEFQFAMLGREWALRQAAQGLPGRS